jgi:hypothetical protein
MFLDGFREKVIEQWNEAKIYDEYNNNHQNIYELPTLSIPIVIKAGNFLTDFLVKTKLENLKILEIMAGNCAGSRTLYKTIEKKVSIEEWICTDIIDYKKTIKENIKFHKIDALTSISRFHETIDILLLMCPPPNPVYSTKDVIENGKTVTKYFINSIALCDYYPIVDFIKFTKLNKKQKYIIFIGEMGASDGTEGIYDFMLNNTDINLVYREMIFTTLTTDYGIVEKELFVFLIK